MLRKVVKGLLLLTGTTVGLPYVITSLYSLLYGWPQKKNRLRRTLHPYKVFAFNYTILQMLHTWIRYAPSYVQWKIFYNSVSAHFVKKNLVYGRNEETLDLYLPTEKETKENKRPVVIFVYGGAWAMRNKEMYGPLCTELANKLKAIVCCPNYSAYPKGYADDMVQDLVDCLLWINDYIADYGGNKDKVVLIGHSSGAHLCIMSILELLHEDIVNTEPPDIPQIRFEESHFSGITSQDGLNGSSGSSGSFCVLNENGNGEKKEILESSTTSSTFEVLNKPDVSMTGESGDTELVGVSGIEKKDVGMTDKDLASQEEMGIKKDSFLLEDSEIQQKESEEEDDAASEQDSIVTVKTIERQHTLVDIGKSIKAIIGLAGVYHIGDHYEHEITRGVEDVSKMARVMYGPSHFDRFSPTTLCKNFARGVRLPKIVLLHGTKDYVVPLSSSTKFADVLLELYVDVSLRIIPDCDHYEICLDLMKTNRHFYEPVMGIILETARKVL